MAEIFQEKTIFTPSKVSIVKGETFWLAVFESIEGMPKIDFDKLADRCGYKNAATARVMFNNKKKALQANNPTANSPTAKRTADDHETKLKRGRKPKPKDEDSELLGTPPKKRGRGRPKKSEMMVSIKSSDSADEEALTDIEF